MIRDRWIEARNGLLSSSRFQRLALALPPLRPVARRRARALFDLVAGFTYSQTLFACVEIDLFKRLAGGPRAIDELAVAVDLPVVALERLAGAASVIGLVDRVSGARLALGPMGAALLGNPGVSAMVKHHRHLYADLCDPVALLRAQGGGTVAHFWAYARGEEAESVADYSALMAASNEPVARALLAAYDVRRHRSLLDVGGGEGLFLAEVRRRAPGMALGLFDLPAVIERAAGRVPDTVLHAGDFARDPLPRGYECITLLRILHDHDDAVAAALLRATCDALPPGGALLIAEPMAGERSAPRVGAAYFGWYFAAMGSGRARTAAEIGAMLTRAGFARWRKLRTALPLSAGVIAAEKT